MPTAQDFHAALATIDLARSPSDRLAHRLHLVLDALGDAEDADTDRLGAALRQLHRVLTDLEDDPVRASGEEILQRAARVDAVLGLLETPDLSRVRTGKLPARLHELCSAIIRLRSALARLRATWRR